MSQQAQSNVKYLAAGVAVIAAVAGVAAVSSSAPAALYATPTATTSSTVTYIPQGSRLSSAAAAAPVSYGAASAARSTVVPVQYMTPATMEVNAPQRLSMSFMLMLAGVASAAVAAVVTAVRSKKAATLEPIEVALLATSGRKSKAQEATDYVLTMPGITAPTGFFDPAGLSRMKTPAQLKYSREAELKHGRIAMLAALGFPFAEEFHPLFPSDSVPSDFSFQLTPLQTYWPAVLLGVGLLEQFSVRTFKDLDDGTWELKDDHVSGDLGFDPLGLKPEDPEKLLGLQNRELNNGRLAMIAIAGMVAQELVSRTDVFETDAADIQAVEAAIGVAMF